MTVYVQRQQEERLLRFECQEYQCAFDENCLWILGEDQATIAAFSLRALSAWWVEKEPAERSAV